MSSKNYDLKIGCCGKVFCLLQIQRICHFPKVSFCVFCQRVPFFKYMSHLRSRNGSGADQLTKPQSHSFCVIRENVSENINCFYLGWLVSTSFVCSWSLLLYSIHFKTNTMLPPPPPQLFCLCQWPSTSINPPPNALHNGKKMSPASQVQSANFNTVIGLHFPM